MTEPRYIFDNANPDAALQVRLLAEILDGHTTDVLTREGVTDGWTCLDLGAGAGTVTAWLAERTGPSGLVVALDQDPRYIGEKPNIEIRTADVMTADLGTGVFDLIHARLLFMHLPQREELLRRAAAALKPGGMLVVSDWDCTRLGDMVLKADDGVAEAFLTFQETLVGLAVANGASADWASRAPQAMLDAGLADVTAEVHNRLWRGGEAGCLLHACNSRQMERVLLARGMTAEQLTLLRDGMADPDTVAWSYPMVTAVGHRTRP